MNKVVIIIEDVQKDFERIKTIISDSFKCRQNYDSITFPIFCSNLRNSLIVNHGNPTSQEKMKSDLLDELRSYCHEDEAPVYLIDYLLNEDDENNIDGIAFRNKILKELYPDKDIPVMFITNAQGTTKLLVDEYCEKKVNNKSICDVVTKPDKGEWNLASFFKDKVNNFIRNAYEISEPDMMSVVCGDYSSLKKKKIFISYSRKDVDFKNELKKHLNILSQFDIIDNWSCDDIKIGNWDNQIQKELDESNVIIYMLSANFFSSSYILEKEVRNVMNKKRDKKSILCVIVSDFIDLDKIENYLKNWQISDKQKAVLMLKDFQYLPYGKEFNQITKQNEEKLTSLKNFSNNGDIETALKQISEKVLDIL